MATNTSLITQVTGQAWVRGTDGSLNPLTQGMRIPVDADVVTATGASVQLQVDGQPLITIGENRDVQLGAEVAQANVDPATAAVAVPAESDAARVLAALDAGNDPLAELDPTAAVLQGGPGGDGGSSFTRLVSVLEVTVPLSLEYPRPTFPTTEEIRLGGTGSNRAPEAIGGGLPGTGLLDQLNDDSDVITPVNISEKFTDPDGHPLTFTATGLPPGLTLDPNTGIISGTLDSSASQGGIGGSGIYNVVITATDPYGASTSLDFTWTTKNPPPVAEDDSATTEENTVVTGNVLVGNNETGAGRDTDPDGDKLTVTEVTNGNGDKVPAGSTITGSNSDSGKGGGSFVINPDGSYSFNPGSDFDYLAAGESTTTTVTYKISDGDGGFDDATLTITITGTNDGPEIISSADDHATTVTEIIDNATGENTTTHQKTGVIEFSDADDSDTHNVTFTPGNPDYLGEFELVVNADKTIGWTFKVDDSAIDYLAAGETLTQEYTVTIDDGKGGKVDQTVTVTIVGTNDAPIINETISEATGAVTEDASESTATGKMDWDDVDNRDTHTWTVKNDGQYGGLTINDKGEWTYTLDNSKANHLPAGKTITDTITVEVDDGNGGTDTKDIVITITGTNDEPVIDGSTVAEGTVKEAGYEVTGTPVVSGQLVATDVDDGDVLSWSLVDGAGKDALTLKGEYGSITLDPATNKWTYTLDNNADATQKLNVGDTRTETFKAYVSDGKGGVVEQEIKVTVEGTNDAPIASADTDTVTESGVKKGGNESEAGKSEANGNVLINDTDIDSAKANLKVSEVSFDGVKGAIGTALEGKYGALTLQADGSYKYVLHNNQENVQNLKAGQKEIETFTYTVVDEYGAKHETTLTITVTGTNDRPVITTAAGNNTGSVTEQGFDAESADSVVTGELTATDVDVDHTLAWNLQAKNGQTVTEGTDAGGQKTTAINGKYGILTLGKDGKWTYELDNTRPATQALKDGDTPTETFTARVQDEHGAWVEQDITVTVTGTNDAPTADQNVVIKFDEDPTHVDNAGHKHDGYSGNVITDNTNNFGEGDLTVTKVVINGHAHDIPEGSSVTVTIPGVGDFSMDADGNYVFTPLPHYSGEVPKIEYTAQEPGEDKGEDGLTASGDLQFVITPVADAPALNGNDTNTKEDTVVKLGLVAPEVVDNTDHNNETGLKGDNPELLGVITLMGIPADAELQHADGRPVAGGGGDIKIVIVNADGTSSHTREALDAAASDSTIIKLTQDEYNNLHIKPPAHSDKNIEIKVDVTSYEVDDQGYPLKGADGNPLDGAKSEATVNVDVRAVTDEVTLSFEDGSKDKSFTMDEDARFDLSGLLTATFEDLDGSEQREIVISGLPVGATVFVGDVAHIVGADGIVTIQAKGQTGGISSFPKIQISPPQDFSGDMNGIKVTLNAQDIDKDSFHGDVNHKGKVESDSVTLDITVAPVADDVIIGGVIGNEDKDINFLANVYVDDVDGSEKITNFVIKDVPTDWVIRDASGAIVPADEEGGTTYTLPKGDDGFVNLDAYKGWTATPPAHSSEDVTFKLDVSTVETVDGVVVDTVTGGGTDLPLNITVKPVAEKVTDNTEGDDLTMTDGHDYSQGIAGKEDGWFTIKQDGFNLQDGWANKDGKPTDGELPNADAADGGTEKTFAVLTPVLNAGAKGDSAAGAQFRYKDLSHPDVDGEGWVVLTFNGKDGVEIPMEFLGTVEFLPPPHVSGEFSIKVEAKTVDTDIDGGTISEAVSGEEWLNGIVIKPVADHVTLGMGGAHGKEDSEIPLIIRPSSADSSETFNVEISGIPEGAVLIYNGEPVKGLVKNPDGTYTATINDFDSNASLTVKPPHNSSDDFDLTVKAESVDTAGGVTDTSDTTQSQITVRVDGVADEANVVFKDNVTFTESALDGGDNTIKLSDIVDRTDMHDADGSETLTFKISGLPDGFTVEGDGVIFMGGEGKDREWTFTADQLKNVTIKTPEHYSGKLPGHITAVTTEKDGDSRTGDPQEWDVTITPSPESDMISSTTVVEDTLTQLNFQADTNHGDKNEVVSTVWIKASDVDGKDFTLYLGKDGVTLAKAASMPDSGVILENGYYKLTGDNVDNVYVKPGDNFAGNQAGKPNPSFDVKYEVTDYANDGSGESSTSNVKEGTHVIEVTPITDPVDLELNDPATDLVSRGEVSVGITLNKKPDANAGGKPDHDGSEQFTQVVIEGVPDGMLVKGLTVNGVDGPIGKVSYLGDGKWLISISEDDYPRFGDGPIEGKVEFFISDHMDNNPDGESIKITVVTQEEGTNQTESAIKDWDFTINLPTGGEGDLPSVEVTWEKNDNFSGAEDTSFTLGDAFTGTLTQTDADGNPISGAADANFTIVLNLSPGSTVTGPDGVKIDPFMVDGKEVWVLTGKGQQQLDDYLNNTTVTPPKNLNDNADGKFKFEVDFTGHLDNGSQSEAGFGKDEDDYLPLKPVTDEPIIDVMFSAVDEHGKPTTDAAQEGRDVAITLNVGNTVDGGVTFGDSVYIKVGEGGLGGGILKDANGNRLSNKISITDLKNPEGLPLGDYYIVPLPDDGKVNLIYTPHPDEKYTSGNLDIEAWVKNQEHGADNWETGGGTTTGKVEGVNNGYGLVVGEKAEGGNWTVKGDENQTGTGMIQLSIQDKGLVDGVDGSEQALAAMLKNLPNGFLVYVKDASGNLVLAGNAGGEGSNSWMIPLTNGKLPEIFVQPPQNWSGTLSDVELSVLSGEMGKETWGESNKFDLVVNPVADGILSFNPAPAFGKEGDIIQLNLNIVMKDDQKAGDTDKSVETITVTLQGLGEHAAFYVDGKLFDMDGSNFIYDPANGGTYTLSGLSQADADKLGFIQAAGAAKGTITVTVETVESGNGDTSGAFESKDFDLNIFDQLATSGDDNLLYGGSLLDGGVGDDTVWLRFGEDLDFDDDAAPVNLKNIETLDLTKPGYDHELLNLGADDVLRITDGRNTLTINADEGDKVSFKDGDGWKLSADKSTDDYDVYISMSTDGKDVEVRISKGLPVDGLLSDGQESLDALLGDTGTQTSPAATRSDTTTELAGALEPLAGDQQSQLINDLIQQGKLTSEV